LRQAHVFNPVSTKTQSTRDVIVTPKVMIASTPALAPGQRRRSGEVLEAIPCFATAGTPNIPQRGGVCLEPILREACSQAYPVSAICVQRFDDSLSSAIRITYRISLRSSSLREPRYPLLRVVFSFRISSFDSRRGDRKTVKHRVFCIGVKNKCGKYKTSG
jgi:hypothetical protein